MTDWVAWHQRYEDPESSLSGRLRIVQQEITAWLDQIAPEPVTVVSVCAGDARDLLGALADRSDASRVRATLLESDRQLAERAASAVRAAGLDGIAVARLDAGATDAYLGVVPADLVLLCGVFGNISDQDVRGVIEALPQLCRPGATVIWTRHTRAPDLTGRIRAWLAATGFDEVSFTAPAGAGYSVGRHRFAGIPQPLAPGVRLFTFTR